MAVTATTTELLSVCLFVCLTGMQQFGGSHHHHYHHRQGGGRGYYETEYMRTQSPIISHPHPIHTQTRYY